MTLSTLLEQVERNKREADKLTPEQREAYQRELDAALARSGAETWRDVQ